jgi:hypothetical protein
MDRDIGKTLKGCKVTEKWTKIGCNKRKETGKNRKE